MLSATPSGNKPLLVLDAPRWSCAHPSGRTLCTWTRSGPAQSANFSGVYSGRLAASALRYAWMQCLQKGIAGIWAVGALELAQNPRIWIFSLEGHLRTWCLKRVCRANWRCSWASLRIVFGTAGA